jgi:hypothetical protein
MLLKEVISVYSENHTKSIHKLCGQIKVLLIGTSYGVLDLWYIGINHHKNRYVHFDNVAAPYKVSYSWNTNKPALRLVCSEKCRGACVTTALRVRNVPSQNRSVSWWEVTRSTPEITDNLERKTVVINLGRGIASPPQQTDNLGPNMCCEDVWGLGEPRELLRG